jgi:oligopeptide/dipeptide ABC transporter ATP-binding protein
MCLTHACLADAKAMTTIAASPLLQVENLNVSLPTPYGLVPAVRNIDLRLERGQTLGIIGESGCGKSITMLALMGLLPEEARVTGSIRLHGQELVGAADATLCQIRGNRVGMIFQDPMSALNPVQTIGRQVAEPLRLHRGLSRSAAHAEAVALLTRVGIADAARRADAYPHQFSGGQRQRITIAMALACGPDLLIADEPTTALDATLQLQILQLLRELVAERGMALILISHDLGVIAQNVDQMLVMYGGSVVERGPTRTVFQHLAHPYTRGLFAARPQIVLRAEGSRPQLPTIAGHVPELQDIPPGCPFAGRCAWTEPGCASHTPEAITVPLNTGSGEHTACCLPHVLLQLERTA